MSSQLSGVTKQRHTGARSAQKLSWSAAQQTDQKPTMTFERALHL